MNIETSTTGPVQLSGGGWAGSIATGAAWARTEVAHDDWHHVSYRIPALTLSHAAALLVTQGMPLQNLFPPDVELLLCEGKKVVYRTGGPLLLIRGEYAQPNDPPPRLNDVILVRVVKTPKDLPHEKVLAYLLNIF